MSNCSRCRCNRPEPDPAPPQEPPVRRWPHPIVSRPAEMTDPTANYIRCALSYQNQLLAEIQVLLTEGNALLEQIAQNTAQTGDKK